MAGMARLCEEGYGLERQGKVRFGKAGEARHAQA